MASANLFHAFNVSASGLSYNRARLNVIATNIANAQTTRTAEGGPFKRQFVAVRDAAGSAGNESTFEQLLRAKQALGIGMGTTEPEHLDDAQLAELTANEAHSLRFAVENDPAQGPLHYEPGHPDADENGYVEYPNIEVVKEMVDLMAASRAYEANVTVMNATKAMLRKALEI